MLMLLVVFAISSMGFNIKVHTCTVSGAEHFSLNTIVNEAADIDGPACCNHRTENEEDNKNCCQDEIIYFQPTDTKAHQESISFNTEVFEAAILYYSALLNSYKSDDGQLFVTHDSPPSPGISKRLATIQVYLI